MADYSISKVDVSELRKILIQAITNTDFLKQIRSFASPAILEEAYSRHILTWCYEYFDVYNQAPQSTIQQIYEQKKAYVLREEDAEAIENILVSISNDFVIKGNVEYYVNLAEQYFNKVAIRGLEKRLSRLADRGRIDEALNEIAKFRKIEKLNPQGVDLLRSDEAIIEAFTETQDVLFTMPGPLGELLGSFNRGDLSAVLAPMKRGKTYSMMDIASFAMQTGHKVWFISLEMTKNQVIRRLWQQWSGSVANREEEIVEPRFDNGNIILETKKVKKMSSRNMMRIREKLRTNMKTSGFKVFSYPQNTFKVSDLKILIENSITYNNELPDFIAIDYASIMQPQFNKDKRFQLDQIWSDLSSLAVEYNIHILTASQTNKAGFTRDIQQGDSAEANSITAHVSKMFALNQTPANKRQHVMRYAIMFNRHSDFDVDKQVVVLQNLACGKSMLDSMWKSEVNDLWEDERSSNEDNSRNY